MATADRAFRRPRLPERLAAAMGNRVLDGVDVDAVARRIDVEDIVDKVDVDALLSRVDMNALLERVDVDRLLERVDVDLLLDRVDVNRLLDRVDIDGLVGRADVAALVQRAGIPDLVAESTGQFAGSALDVARRQIVGVDALVSRAAFRATGRRPADVPVGPGSLGLDPPVDPSLPPRTRVRARARVTGHYAGPVSRLLAFIGDYAVAVGLAAVVAAVVGYAVDLILDLRIEAGAGVLGVVWFAVWAFLYWWLGLAVAGRTVGMAVLGLRVVRADGSPLPSGRAAGRVLLMPVSFLVVGLGLIGVLLDRRRRALHDALSGTTVVYDWGDRPAEMPSPLSAWLDRHGETPDLPAR